MKYGRNKIEKGEIEYKRPEPKVIKVNLSLLVGIIFAILILFSSLAGHKISTIGTKVLENLVEEVTVTVTASSSIDLSDYKATDELTEEDKENEYQKNYQETAVDDDNYLIKTAEWTDKENGEALITIEGSLTVEQETTALYVTSLCLGHGLTKDIIVDNIQYLTEYYDKIDFIIVMYNPDSDYCWYEPVTYTSDSTTSEITSYVSEMYSTYGTGSHFSTTIIPCLQEYLFGKIGDDYISEDNLINDPVAIYISFDGFYILGKSISALDAEQLYIDEDWADSYGTEKFFNFLYEKYGDEGYQTMSSTYGTEFFVTMRSYPRNSGRYEYNKT